MSRLPHLAVFFFAAVHLLLFSVCQVSGRIYRTNDAVVIEVDDIGRPGAFANRNFGYPALIPMMYAVNPVHPYTGLYYQQQPNFPLWPYPLYLPASSFSDVENVTATSPESKQAIACGVGPPPPPPQRQTPAGRIIGGTNAKMNSWPFMVGLKMSEDFSTDCGGTLISTTRILTSASCVNKLSVLGISKLTVSLGMNNQGAFDISTNQRLPNDAQELRKVTRVVYHLDYNDKTKKNDIAVLTIDPPVIFSKDISPVCLPEFNNAADPFSGQKATIMGWGRTATGFTLTLQQATAQVITNADCNAAYKAAVTKQQFCTATSGPSACKYDDGGPLVTQDPQTSAWTQAGVFSYGSGCDKPATPGVYANVAFFRNWINTYMKS